MIFFIALVGSMLQFMEIPKLKIEKKSIAVIFFILIIIISVIPQAISQYKANKEKTEDRSTLKYIK